MVGALLLAGELSSLPAPVRGTGVGYTRTIRGLVAFDEDDAAAFACLQRGADISRGANALLDPQFRFGVLFAESRAGKTSLLRAGVLPALKSQGYTLFINDIDNLEEPVQLVTRLVGSPENPSWLALFDSGIIANDHPKHAASVFPTCSGSRRMRFQSSSDRASART